PSRPQTIARQRSRHGRVEREALLVHRLQTVDRTPLPARLQPDARLFVDHGRSGDLHAGRLSRGREYRFDGVGKRLLRNATRRNHGVHEFIVCSSPFNLAVEYQPPPAILTAWPGLRRSAPRTTRRSPAASAPRTSTLSPVARLAETGTCSAVFVADTRIT